MFVDASAIVAILTRESDADALADTLDGARSPITSPVAVFEATLGICRKRHASVSEGQEDVLEFLETAGVRTVSTTGKEAEPRWTPSPDTARAGATRLNATWETASPMRSQEPTGHPSVQRRGL